MNRAEKVAMIEELSGTFKEMPHFVLAGFSGLTVDQATDLRRRIRETGGSYRVIKNRLAKRAAQGTPFEPLGEQLTGPRAIAYHPDDPMVLVKALSGFVSDNPQVELLGAVIDAHEVLDGAGIETLAKLPGLPELRAQLLALILTPATQVVRMISAPGQKTVTVIDARREKLAAGGDA